jgi:hypothetical protein
MNGHQPGALDVHVALGDEALHELLLFELLAAVHLAGGEPLHHQVEGAPHGADGVHAVVYATGAESILRGLVAGAGAAELVLPSARGRCRR